VICPQRNSFAGRNGERCEPSVLYGVQCSLYECVLSSTRNLLTSISYRTPARKEWRSAATQTTDLQGSTETRIHTRTTSSSSTSISTRTTISTHTSISAHTSRPPCTSHPRVKSPKPRKPRLVLVIPRARSSKRQRSALTPPPGPINLWERSKTRRGTPYGLPYNPVWFS
jgi:hypothetical protein